MKDSRLQLQLALDEIVAEVKSQARKVFDEAVIDADLEGTPKPRQSDFESFGIAVLTHDGNLVRAGNAGTRFPIQSISKVFALELALEHYGEQIWNRVGREPSGDTFNSIIDLERNEGIPRNPFINAGALVVADALLSIGGDDPDHRVFDFVKDQLEKETA